MPRLSVITPSLDQGRFIRRTIDSVLSQGIADIEYRVLDGGSRDETLDVLRSFGDRLTWVSEPDRGQSHAVNKGFAATRGEIVGWLNSDDRYAPGALAAVVSFLEARPDVDVVYGDATFVDENDAVRRPFPAPPWSHELLTASCFIAQPATFVRRRVIDRLGGLDETLHFAMDYEYWLRLAAGGASFAHLPRVLAACRVHRGTKTHRFPVAHLAEVMTVWRRTLGAVPDDAIRRHARLVLEARGLPAGRHPVLHRLASVPLAYATALRFDRSAVSRLLRWHLGWPVRVLARKGPA